MRKIYTAPEAKLMCFAPCEEITSGWSKGDSWKTDGVFWTSDNDNKVFPGKVGSVQSLWYDFGTDEID